MFELKLSCYCCGGTKFKKIPKSSRKIEGDRYLDLCSKAYLECSSCGLEDLITNLVPKVEVDGSKLIETVTPDYARARRIGISDEEAEQIVLHGIYKKMEGY